jgi:protein O-mannosyl-transferase
MTRKRRNRLTPKSRLPENTERIISGSADRLAYRRAFSFWNRYRTLAVCGFLLLAVLLVFGQTVNHDFVNYDDDVHVSQNLHVMRGLTGEGIVWAITTYHACNWQPLTWLSHQLDCQIYGLKAGGHHLSNVILHAAAAMLLFLALQRLTGAFWPSAWVAAVFAIHPLRVESVAWVVERKDVLSGLFFALTLWCYARYVEQPKSWGRYLLVIAVFALGLTAKPMLVTLPFVLLLLDYWPLGRFEPLQEVVRADEANPPRRRRILRLIVEKIPLFVLAAAACAITLAAQSSTIKPFEHLPFPWRLSNAIVAYVAYLGKMFYPVGLAVLYPLHPGPPPAWKVAAALGVLLSISAAVFFVRRRHPYLLVGWLWYLGTLVPVIGFVQVGEQSMADRYTYLTQIGLYLAITWGLTELVAVWPVLRWKVSAVSALALAVLMVCAWRQTRHWRDSEVLWAHTLACTSENSVAHNNLGLTLACRGEVEEALAQYRKALEIDPDYDLAQNNMGIALANRGQVEEAIAYFRKVLQTKPDDYGMLNNLANALASRGRAEEAIVHYEKALKINPDNAFAHYNFGIALADCGRIDEAIAHYRKALGLASAQNDKALADLIRARIEWQKQANPNGNAPQPRP